MAAMAGDSPNVPIWIRTGAAYSWRLIAMGALIVFAARVIAQLQVLAMPIVAALFLSTLLIPMATRLRRHGVAPVLATWAVMLLTIGVIVVVLLGLYPSLHSEFVTLKSNIRVGFDEVKHWLITGPLHVSTQQLDEFNTQVSSSLSKYQNAIVAGALSGISTVVQVLAASLLTLVLTFFFVKDGTKMTAWFVDLFDHSQQDNLGALGTRLWRVISGYIHGTAVNGLVNATAMSAGLLLLGVPLVIPVAVLTFFGGFLPIVGAFASGGIAALVALVAKGPLVAGGVILLTVLVHHLEGYLVGPYVLGRAVRLHPVAILLSLSAGSIVAGIFGAFVAVPLTAAIAEVVAFLRGRSTAVTERANAPSR